jgi:hypothetical protein
MHFDDLASARNHVSTNASQQFHLPHHFSMCIDTRTRWIAQLERGLTTSPV